MSGSEKPKRGGFRLKNLPEDAYKGQQQRIKQNLIQKAKLKKNYAKVLKQEASVASHVLPSKPVAQSNESDEPRVVDQSDESFTEFGNEPTKVEAESGKSDAELPPKSAQSAGDIQRKSYRQRARDMKKDPAAAKAFEIRMQRDRDSQLVAAKRAQIDKKRADRGNIKKREMSRTKRGQPLMKDRMKNILDKLQSDS